MERKEPTLTGVAALEPSRATAQDVEQELPSKHGPSVVAVMALLVAIAGLGGSGFLAWKLTESEKELTLAKGRITGLETRLNLSSDQSTQTVEDIEDKLKWADSEIRKLWGVSNDTNKKKIASNASGLSALKKSLASVKNTATKAQSSVALNRRELNAKIKALQVRANTVSNAIAQLEIQAITAAQLGEDVERMTQQLPGLQGVIKRVKTNEESIAAIDAYRRSINRDLLQLKKQISNSTAP